MLEKRDRQYSIEPTALMAEQKEQAFSSAGSSVGVSSPVGF
jgi:hypothetical protein